jgi:hypothetical protein
MATPSGELGKGPVENVEAVRVAMTYSTFKEVAELFNFTARKSRPEKDADGRGQAKSLMRWPAG